MSLTGSTVEMIEGPVPAGLLLRDPRGREALTTGQAYSPAGTAYVRFRDSGPRLRGMISTWVVVEDRRPARQDRPRWADADFMQVFRPIDDESLARHAASPALLPSSALAQAMRRLADTEVALARARAEIVELRARAVLGA